MRARDINVKAIRENLDMTQEVFSETFAIPVSTLKKWETNNRVPEGPTKAYLTVIEKNPRAVKKALHSAVHPARNERTILLEATLFSRK